MLVFDIETEPLPEDQLRELLPPLDESSLEVGEFNPDDVKLGNAKKPETVKKKIEEAYEEHAKRKAMQGEIIEAARKEHWERFQEAAPLSAAFGRVLCIGVYLPHKDLFRCIFDTESERSMLDHFWTGCVTNIRGNRSLVGLNTHEFDLPFLVRRSWILGVPVPNIIGTDLYGKWPKWNARFIDLRRVWLLGSSPTSTKSNFGVLASAFGTAGKTEESGKEFWKLWREDQPRALAYLEQDVRQPAEWAQRMGVR